MAITKIPLSSSTDGKMIQAGASLHTNLHTASSDPDDIDEIWIWACNIYNADYEFDLGWGAAGSTTTNNTFTVPTEAGLYLVAPGLLLEGKASFPKSVTAYTVAADRINFAGYVNRHSA
jgi:hypothetical protein